MWVLAIFIIGMFPVIFIKEARKRNEQIQAKKRKSTLVRFFD